MTEYPKLDIRTYDSHLSTKLADMVTGTFEFYGMPHDVRVMRLKAIMEVYDAVMRLGDLEHTGDWDWRISVYYAATPHELPTEVGGDREDVWSDTIRLDYEVFPEDYTEGFVRWENLIVEERDHDTDELTDVPVPIDSIRLITIGTA